MIRRSWWQRLWWPMVGYTRSWWWSVVRSEAAQRRQILRTEIEWSGKGLSPAELDELVTEQRASWRRRWRTNPHVIVVAAFDTATAIMTAMCGYIFGVSIQDHRWVAATFAAVICLWIGTAATANIIFDVVNYVNYKRKEGN